MDLTGVPIKVILKGKGVARGTIQCEGENGKKERRTMKGSRPAHGGKPQGFTRGQSEEQGPQKNQGGGKKKTDKGGEEKWGTNWGRSRLGVKRAKNAP